MKCPFCGTDNPAGETFCTNCGGYLDASPAPATGSGGATVVSSGGVSTGTTTVGGGVGTSGTLTPNAHLQNGRYIVEKILGQGGMGAAVLAKDTRVSNKRVVIKELVTDSSDPTQRQEDVRNFQREVETLAELDHPLIPTVTDSFQEGSRYFMVQEYVAGENLESMIERVNKPLPESEVLGYSSQVLDILDYLGRQKPPIVHRDIKPANIIVGSRDKRAHLVDFGIARADEAKNAKKKQTSALGTPGYAPPEQYQGNADGRSDLYALAATMHHLLTNRDPRNYPPFNYPPARSLNPKLSPEIERVLEKALSINVNQRYQSAAEMKQEIDEILTGRFSVPADTSSYTLSRSGPIATPPRPAPSTQAQHTAQQPRPFQQAAPGPGPRQMPPVQQRAASPVASQSQVSTFAPPAKQQSGNNYVMRSFLALVAVVVVVGAIFFVIPRLGSSQQPGTTTATATPGANATTAPLPGNGIGATQVNGELIGISDGTVAFDTTGANGQDKIQASQALAKKDLATAQSLWRSALAKQSNDAEPLIYLENQRVISSGRPYITIVVATMLTGQDVVGTGRDDLQGAYVLQKEFNANNGAALGGTMVRLLIANSGSDAKSATQVAQQIVQAVKADPTIVGVMGWPYSGQTINAVNVLSAAKIPMVSSTASSDSLSGISPYFFRVAAPDKSQAKVGAQYAMKTLKAKNVAVFQDAADAYSQSLAQGFSQQFTASGGQVIPESYKRGQPDTIKSALQHALRQVPAPDLIYFAGYSNDVSTILEELPKNTDFPNLQVLGGDALYNLGGYPQSAQAGFTRLHFTAFAYPDEWGILGYGSKQPAFFTDYPNAFDPDRTHQGSPYGFTRAAYNVVLSYDATLSLATAAKNALAEGKKTITGTDVQQALSNLKGANAVQGVSGQISFDQNGDPVDKAVLILFVDQGGHIQMTPQLGAGKFLVQ